MKKKRAHHFVLIVLLCFYSVIGCAEKKDADKIQCNGSLSTIDHVLMMNLNGREINDFYYLATTPQNDTKLSCSIDFSDAIEAPVKDGNRLTYNLGGNELLVITRTSDGFSFDLSRLKVTNWCGQSSTMAKTISIKLGDPVCHQIENF